MDGFSVEGVVVGGRWGGEGEESRAMRKGWF